MATLVPITLQPTPSLLAKYLTPISHPVMLAAKTTSDASRTTPFPPDPNSPSSTISTVAREIHETGGQASTVAVDVRDPDQIQHAFDETLRVYGKLDVLVYNSGAIWWSSVENTPLKRFKLMQAVNPEGLYASVQAALPVFGRGDRWRGRIVVVCPPIYSRFFRGKTGYAMGMYCIALRLELGVLFGWLLI